MHNIYLCLLTVCLLCLIVAVIVDCAAFIVSCVDE